MTSQFLLSNNSTIPNFSKIVLGMMTVFSRNNAVYFNFRNPRDKLKYAGNSVNDLKLFAKKIRSMKIPVVRGLTNQGICNDTPLDLNVNEPSAIVIAIPKESNMQFSNTTPAISCKEKHTTELYCNLIYIDYSDEDEVIFRHKPFENCKSVIFFARNPPAIYPNGHGFNIHIDIVRKRPDGSNQILPIIIDPEVKHPGGLGSN